MAERVLVLTADGGAPLAPKQALALERVQARSSARRRAPRAPQRARPEHLAEHRGILDQSLLLGASPSSRAAMIPWMVSGSGRSSAEPRSDVQARELLGVERVAAGALEQRLLRLGRQHRLLEDLAR